MPLPRHRPERSTDRMAAPQRGAPGRLRHVTSPVGLARLVTVLGAVNIVSALLPAWRDRLAVLAGIVPPVAPAAATAGAAAAGVLLIALAQALRRGGRRAWCLATGVAAAAILLNLVKGLDVEEASLAAVVLLLLVAGRRRFTAAPRPRSTSTTCAVAIAAVLIGTVLGFVLLSLGAAAQAASATWDQRLAQATLGLVGIAGPVVFRTTDGQDDAAVSLVVLGTACLLTTLLVALRPPGGAHPLSGEEEVRLRALLDRQAEPDSLAYFALRRNRAVVFSPSGK